MCLRRRLRGGRPKMGSGRPGIAQLQFALEIAHLPLQARHLVHQREQVAAGGHPPRVSLHLVTYVKVALCKDPVVVAAVLPAPATRAGPEGLDERPDLHNAPCPPRCRRTMFGRGSMLVAASLRGQWSFSPCLPSGRRWGIRMFTAPATPRPGAVRL